MTWDVVAEPGFSEVDKWRSWVNPRADQAQSFLSVSEAVENLNVNPEDITLEPENIQTGRRDWSVQADLTSVDSQQWTDETEPT